MKIPDAPIAFMDSCCSNCWQFVAAIEAVTVHVPATAAASPMKTGSNKYCKIEDSGGWSHMNAEALAALQ
jgi:hypothetical protein